MFFFLEELLKKLHLILKNKEPQLGVVSRLRRAKRKAHAFHI